MRVNLEESANSFLIEKLRGFENTDIPTSIRILAAFESAHYLYNYMGDGRDEPVHGHTWKVEIELARLDFKTDKEGLVYDFIDAQKGLQTLTDRIDHCCINDLEEFQGINPSTENIAKWFYRGMQSFFESKQANVQLIAVYVHEGPHNMAICKGNAAR